MQTNSAYSKQGFLFSGIVEVDVGDGVGVLVGAEVDV
jgi:hypothetical protein